VGDPAGARDAENKELAYTVLSDGGTSIARIWFVRYSAISPTRLHGRP
jgi:hypothetical protein